MENWKVFNREAEEKPPATDGSFIPIVEEHLRVGTKIVETGQVNITKKVIAEDVTLDVPVSHEEVIIERREINQYVKDLPPASRQQGETTILSVFKEVLVVEKKILLVEEVHITKKVVESSVPIVETIRKEEVIVTRTSIDGQVE